VTVRLFGPPNRREVFPKSAREGVVMTLSVR
jgi:hypothetical protein